MSLIKKIYIKYNFSAEFGSLDWTQDESAVVYVAEKKLKKSEPYIKRKSEDKSKTDGNGDSAPKKVN